MRHVTKRAVPSMWFWLAYTVLYFVFLDVTRFLTGFERLLAFGCWALVFVLVYYVFQHGDVILSEEGMELTNIVRRKKIPWTAYIQVVSAKGWGKRMLVLVKEKNDYIKPGNSVLWFRMKHPNTVCLPDSEIIREILSANSLPVEFEL